MPDLGSGCVEEGSLILDKGCIKVDHSFVDTFWFNVRENKISLSADFTPSGEVLSSEQVSPKNILEVLNQTQQYPQINAIKKQHDGQRLSASRHGNRFYQSSPTMAFPADTFMPRGPQGSRLPKACLQRPTRL